MKAILRAGILCASIAVGGCATFSSSELRDTYQSLTQQQQALGNNTQISDAEKRQQDDTIMTGYAAVAGNALALAKTSSGPDKVSLLALAASAGARTRGKAAAIALEAADLGRSECASLPPQQGAPRDCALLLFTPDLIARDQIISELPRLPPRTYTPELDKAYVDAVAKRAGDINALASSMVENWRTLKVGDGPYQGVSPETVQYLGSQVKASGCQIYQMIGTLKTIAAHDRTMMEEALKTGNALTPAVETYRAALDQRVCAARA